MGDSRSWGEMVKDDIETCRYGFKHRHFEKCQCEGCTSDRLKSHRKNLMVKELTDRYERHLRQMSVTELESLKSSKDKNRV